MELGSRIPHWPDIARHLPSLGDWRVWLAAVALYILAVASLVGTTAPPQAEPASSLTLATLQQAWDSGQVIALVRHEERCDRSLHACQGPEDGITLVGQAEARRLGGAFRRLDFAGSDVYHSPATRTAQTASAMFGMRSQARDWAANCTADWMNQMRQHKETGRNLVVVTHSECMDRTLQALGRAGAKRLGYGSTLFLRVGPDGTLQPMALLDAKRWIGQ